MNCAFVPTLEDIAIRRVAQLLYNDPELSRFSECEPYGQPTTEWKELVNEKVSKLFLTAPLQRRLFVTVRSHSFWIRQFYALHHKFSYIGARRCQCLKRVLQNSYLWPSDGSSDKAKIVDSLVRDQRINAVFRFILACEFMREQGINPCRIPHIPLIREIWSQLSRSAKVRAYSDCVRYKVNSIVLELLAENL
ncbi:hypothetical protein AVEN_217005-1 [Araneus ventricosus]|uniref:Uncharacterized protein n=1 Tax=Araneus ventricosus TaxID=182803 RepID=A0A4Y2TPA6_ARAVE|nr:hypothetical protein AVEN_217005-1 [Araneus ventricosus]